MYVLNGDYIARGVLADLAECRCVSDNTTKQLTTKFIFGNNKYPNKEEKKMSVCMIPDEICEYLSLTTKKPNAKPKWLEGLPAVKKVETYNDRVVKVTFIDDTFTKSVCSENDHFDIDVGITICLLKRVMGTNSDNATKNYNKLMNQIHGVMEKNEKEKLTVQAQKAADKTKKRKIELKKAAKKLKAKEEQIDIHKQAIIRAHQEMEGMVQ